MVTKGIKIANHLASRKEMILDYLGGSNVIALVPGCRRGSVLVTIGGFY